LKTIYTTYTCSHSILSVRMYSYIISCSCCPDTRFQYMSSYHLFMLVEVVAFLWCCTCTLFCIRIVALPEYLFWIEVIAFRHIVYTSSPFGSYATVFLLCRCTVNYMFAWMHISQFLVCVVLKIINFHKIETACLLWLHIYIYRWFSCHSFYIFMHS